MMHFVQPPPPANPSISRRFLLWGSLATAASSVPFPALALESSAQKPERTLDFYNVNTGESLRTVYWIKGQYDPRALQDINYILRDHNNNEIKPMDPQLLNLLYHIGRIVGLRDSFHVLAAYRSPSTNTMRRLDHSEIAEHSMHVEGKAVDVRFFKQRDLYLVRRLTTVLQWGGVSYHPSLAFVHLDTGWKA